MTPTTLADEHPIFSMTSIASVQEGNAGITNFIITISRTHALVQSEVTLVMPTGNIDEKDFGMFGGTPFNGGVNLTFATGELEKTVILEVKGDTDYEEYETFSLLLLGAVNATVNAAASTANGKIINDDSGSTAVDGDASNNTLDGGVGDDTLSGGNGNDVLTGGAGRDVFAFKNAPKKRSNFDTITDFNVVDDAVWLSKAVFTKLGKKGSETAPVLLNKKHFVVGNKAKDKDDYIIYKKSTGILYYDNDGSGSAKAVEIPKFATKPGLTHQDFFIV
ncbi:calcium-binding protein [Microvirga aerophila]|uniref:Peptidase M10 serralysin C-terminal domain-containing protein n=1 Tax=Microvirga aerophila TaxID=670291 RepID=A0A512C110_9HYPH|nr:hypothetical protein [Microvirga aerophila]GEO17885.1 hypothetical protein MAE02_55810 [Microvirga aerophila]